LLPYKVAQTVPKEKTNKPEFRWPNCTELYIGDLTHGKCVNQATDRLYDAPSGHQLR
jgi:hypothetical protein